MHIQKDIISKNDINFVIDTFKYDGGDGEYYCEFAAVDEVGYEHKLGIAGRTEPRLTIIQAQLEAHKDICEAMKRR